MKRGIQLAATLGLAACTLGFVGLPAAQADRDDWHDRYHAPIRREVFDVRRDERELHDLQWRRDQAARESRWRTVRDLDRQIDRLQDHIDRDRHEIHEDFHHDR